MKKKTRIAFVLKSSIYSGAENVAISIIKGLEDRYEFMYIATQGEIEDKLLERGVPHQLLKKFNLSNLKSILKTFKPDIVHAHDFSASVYCAALQKKYGYKLISHIHYDPPWAGKWNLRTILYYLTSQRISKIIAVTKTSYKNMIFSDALEGKTVYINNPIDSDRIKRMAEAEENEEYDLLFVGRLVEQKNPESFIRIVKSINECISGVKCAIIGEGDLKVDCQKMIREYGIQEQLKLLGYQKNPYRYMKHSKVVCMTSRWEGFGLVAAEANTLGVPALSTRTAGVTEVLGEKAEELCKDESEMIEKIKCLLNSPECYEKYKNAAIKRSENFVSTKRYLNHIEDVYREIICTL